MSHQGRGKRGHLCFLTSVLFPLHVRSRCHETVHLSPFVNWKHIYHFVAGFLFLSLFLSFFNGWEFFHFVPRMLKQCIIKNKKRNSFKGCLLGRWQWHKCFFLLTGPTHRKEENNGPGALRALDSPGEASGLRPAAGREGERDPFSCHGPPTLLHSTGPLITCQPGDSSPWAATNYSRTDIAQAVHMFT